MNTTEQNSSAATTTAKAKQAVLDPEKKTVYLGNHFADFANLDDLVKMRKALECWFLSAVSLEINDNAPTDNDLTIESNIFYYQRLTAFLDRMMQPAVELEQAKGRTSEASEQ